MKKKKKGSDNSLGFSVPPSLMSASKGLGWTVFVCALLLAGLKGGNSFSLEPRLSSQRGTKDPAPRGRTGYPMPDLESVQPPD